MKEWIRSAARWILLRALFALSPRSQAGGFEVIDVAEEEGEVTLDRLRSVLELIAQVDQRRYQRMQRDLKRIVLMKAGGPEYASETEACILSSGYVRDGDPGVVAATLVHEATHARLCKAGIGYGRSIRARVEQLCVREEMAFAVRLGRQDVLAHLQQKLASPWWTEAALKERRKAALAALRASTSQRSTGKPRSR
jgi:hypothetical protein